MWVGKIVDEKGANYLDFNQNPYLDMVRFFLYSIFIYSVVYVFVCCGFFCIMNYNEYIIPHVFVLLFLKVWYRVSKCIILSVMY